MPDTINSLEFCSLQNLYQSIIKTHIDKQPHHMQQRMNAIPTNTRKVDQCFSTTVQKLAKSNNCLLMFYVVRILFIIGYLAMNLTIAENQGSIDFQMVNIFYVLALACNIIYLVYANILKFQVYQNLQKIYLIADRTQHIQEIDENQEVAQSYYESPQMKGLLVCRQKFQFSTNIARHEVDDIYIKRAQRNCSTMIMLQIDKNNFYRLFNQLNNLMSISLFIYGLVVIFEDEGTTPSYHISFIITYLFTQMLTRMFIYLVLLVLLISPVFCLGACIYTCFCVKEEKVVLPQKISATQSHIKECEGDCPICYQRILQNEQIIVLRCSSKHVFHELCIKGWTKIGKTCPICRQPIGSE